MMCFLNERGSRAYRRKKDTLVKHVFLNFEPFLANWAIKFQKSANMTQQLFLHKILIWVSKQPSEKFANKKVIGKKPLLYNRYGLNRYLSIVELCVSYCASK